MNRIRIKTVAIAASRQVCLLSIVVLLAAGACFGKPAVSLSRKSGPPTSKLLVSGNGYKPYAEIDIYFDTKDEAKAIANGSGSFSKIAIEAPASALPGKHFVSAVQRAGGTGAQAPFLVNTDWSQYGFTPDGTRLNPYENVLSPGTVGAIDERWNFTTGGAVASSPAVVNGVVYVGSYTDNDVYALNAATGAKLWSFTTGSVVASSPAVANGVVYVGSEDHNVYALNATTGAELWTFTTGWDVYASPVVADGVVYVGSFDEDVYALNAATGAKLWSFMTGGAVESSPAVANGVVYVASIEPANIYALNAVTGAELWSFTADGSVYSSLTVANGVVYVGTYADNNVYALNATTGAPSCGASPWAVM